MTFDASKPQLIQSANNSMVKHAYSLKVPKKLKFAEDFLCEGFHLVLEAFKSDLRVRFVFATAEGYRHPEGQQILDLAKRHKTRCFEVTPQIISYLSETVTPQGMLAVAQKVETHYPDFDSGFLLGVYQVQDAGNMGTLFRSAEAFGIKGLLLTEGCCDPFNPKVVRSAMGSLFRVPFMTGKSWGEYMTWSKENNASSYALAQTASDNLIGKKFGDKNVLWVGSEGEGVPAELAEACDGRLLIPMKGQVESLNVAVAASIAMFQANMGQNPQ